MKCCYIKKTGNSYLFMPLKYQLKQTVQFPEYTLAMKEGNAKGLGFLLQPKYRIQ